MAKYSYWRRPIQDVEYGVRLAAAVRHYKPDVIISANTPLISQVLFELLRPRTRLIYWYQDRLGEAMAQIARNKLGVLGPIVAATLRSLDRWTLGRASLIVPIASDFEEALRSAGIRTPMRTIENWAPVEELVPEPPENDWSLENGLATRPIFLYAGTLGLKQQPTNLVRIAQVLDARHEGMLVIVSEGTVVDAIRKQCESMGLRNVRFLPFQPFEHVPLMHGTADVLLALLEDTPEPYAVPSKILTYLCAGRAILGVMPIRNPAARLLLAEEAGVVVPPGDDLMLEAAIDRLLGDEDLRSRLGRHGRRYAEAQFALSDKADRFEAAVEATL